MIQSYRWLVGWLPCRNWLKHMMDHHETQFRLIQIEHLIGEDKKNNAHLLLDYQRVISWDLATYDNANNQCYCEQN